MLDDHIDNTVAYSLGISDEVSWDLDMAKSGCQVFQYDHTIQRAPCVHPNLHFSRIGIAGRSSPDGVFKSLSDLIHENGNDGRSDMILKMDIEGSEWSVIRELRQSTLNQFSHVLIEWHFDFHEIAGVDSLGLVLSTLEKINASHQVIHVHANNCGRMAVVAGVSIPEGIEVTYVRRNSRLFEECRKVYPTPLDRPKRPEHAGLHSRRFRSTLMSPAQRLRSWFTLSRGPGPAWYGCRQVKCSCFAARCYLWWHPAFSGRRTNRRGWTRYSRGKR